MHTFIQYYRTENNLVPVPSDRTQKPIGSQDGGLSNTPHNLQTPYAVRCDWVTLVGVLNTPEAIDVLLRDVSDIFTDGFERREVAIHRGRTYTGGFATSTYGIQLAWDGADVDKPRFRLAVPGRACARIDALDLCIWIHGLLVNPHISELGCTRLDAAFDDYTKELFSYGQLKWAFENRCYVRLRKPSVTASGLKTDPYGQGWTFKLGGKRKNINFYNKAAESKGQIDAHRIEVRYGERDADLAFKTLCQLPMESFEEFATEFFSGLVVGMVDFMTFPKGREHGVRDGRRLSWWSKILKIAKSILRFSYQPPKPNVEKKVDWIKRQVASSIAQLNDIMGQSLFDSWMSDLVKTARERYSDIHKEFIKVTLQELHSEMYA